MQIITVADLFESEKLTKEILEVAGEESSYWEKGCSFVLQNWEREISKLTQKQVAWLMRIQEDLTERRIKGDFK